jgi:hypothetical protein
MPCHFHVYPLKVGALLSVFAQKVLHFDPKFPHKTLKNKPYLILPTMVYEYAICCYSINFCIKNDWRSSVTRLEESYSYFFSESDLNINLMKLGKVVRYHVR